MHLMRFLQPGERVRNARMLLAVLLAAGIAPACTDLSEDPLSSITPTNFYQTDAEVRSGVAAVYTQLAAATIGGGNGADWYSQEITSDELVLPTRGQDWFDNGTHIEARRALWTANSPLALRTNGIWGFANTYNTLYIGVARANTLLEALGDKEIANRERTEAELRVLRAFFYWRLLDNFGGVPIVTDTEIKPRPRDTNVEVFDFIVSELKAAEPTLPDRWPAADYGRVTKGTVNGLLATLYLNAQVYKGTVTAAGLQKGTAQWQLAADHASKVIGAIGPNGTYRLDPDWSAIFKGTNNTSPEMVFVVTRRPEANANLTLQQLSLHYNHVTPRFGANGYSVLPATYRKLTADPADKRPGLTFLAGPQFNLGNSTQPVNDRANNRLVLTVDIANLTQASEVEGVRFYKWPLDPARGNVSANNGNDFAIIRVAELYLIRAEALNELGQTSTALADLNAVRQRGGASPKTGLSQAALRQAIFDERQIELFAEMKRRTDMIRQGTFTDPQWERPNGAAPYKVLFPIPQTIIDSNPDLAQNPGY
jgi:starch-binding outer membrane protein, SusD/RagB family